MTVLTAQFVHVDGTRVTEKIIGVGGTGIVIQQGQYALKIPRLSKDLESDGVFAVDESVTPQASNRKRQPPDHVKSVGVTPSGHQKIEKHEMEAVSKLYTKAETRRCALQPTEKPLISMKDAEEIVEECIESEFREREPIQTDNEEEKVVGSDILDNTTLDQCGASNVLHAESMDYLTWQLDTGQPPCADAIQTLLKYKEDLTTLQSRIHTSRSKSVIDLTDIFDSDVWVDSLLTYRRRYKCTDHRETKGRFFQIKYLSIRLPDGINAITIRPELTPQD